MSISYEARDGYLYVRAGGEYNPSAELTAFSEMIRKARSYGLTRILYSIIHLTGFDADQSSVMARYETAKRMAEMVPNDFKVVFLTTAKQIRKDRFGETVMVNRGVTVKVTADLQEAFEWLAIT